MHICSTITCEDCGWQGANWFCANWTDHDSSCRECIDTSQRVGELWAPSHKCYECHGPASYPLPMLKEQQQIRAIAEATKDMSKMEQAIYAAGMFAAYDMWNDPMVMEGIANFLVDAEDTTGALAKLLPFIEDTWYWFKNMPPKERVAFLRSKAEAETEEVDPIYRYTYTPDSDWDSDAETLCEECGAQGHAKEDCIADQESYDDLYIANRAH